MCRVLFTANARALGSWQRGTLTTYDPFTGDGEGVTALGCVNPNAPASIGADRADLSRYPALITTINTGGYTTATTVSMSATVRPLNVAFHPRIHV